MTKFIDSTKRTFSKFINHFPTKLPIGKTELDEYSTSIFSTYGFPDYPGYRQCIATMILHEKPTTSHKPKRFFAKCVIKAQANEVAFEKLEELKEQAKAAQEKAKIESNLTVVDAKKKD